MVKLYPAGKVPDSISNGISLTIDPPLSASGSKSHAPTSAALIAWSAPSSPLHISRGSSDIRTKLASSHSTHSLCVVMMTRMPALTAPANRRVNSTCAQVSLGFFDDKGVARPGDMAKV